MYGLTPYILLIINFIDALRNTFFNDIQYLMYRLT